MPRLRWRGGDEALRSALVRRGAGGVRRGRDARRARRGRGDQGARLLGAGLAPLPPRPGRDRRRDLHHRPARSSPSSARRSPSRHRRPRDDRRSALPAWPRSWPRRSPSRIRLDDALPPQPAASSTPEEREDDPNRPQHVVHSSQRLESSLIPVDNTRQNDHGGTSYRSPVRTRSNLSALRHGEVSELERSCSTRAFIVAQRGLLRLRDRRRRDELRAASLQPLPRPLSCRSGAGGRSTFASVRSAPLPPSP